MAQVRLHKPMSIHSALAFYGTLHEASANRIVITDYHRTTVYEGAFSYSGGDLAGGTVTAVAQFTLTAADFVATDLSVDALAAADLIHSNDVGALLQIALRGPDMVLGTNGADVLLGHDGNDLLVGGPGADRLEGGAGRDLLSGDAGNDVLVGGEGSDTAWTEALRRQVVHSGAGTGPLTGPDGTDTLISIEAIRFVDGRIHFGPDTAGGGVHRLYLAALGRPADTIGLGAWTAALETGTLSIEAVVAGFTDSAEFARRYGAPDAGGFVGLLYQNVLGRAPDMAGLDHWAGALNSGAATRQDVVLGFSDSAEFKLKTAPGLANGLWAPDPAAVDVLRVYLAMLDRLPDAGGLAHWTNAHKGGGVTTGQLETAFIGSAEFGAKYGATSNAGFVDLLYRNVLDRVADAGGAAFWAEALDTGRLSRAEVVHGFAFSDEMTAKVLPYVSDGIAFV